MATASLLITVHLLIATYFCRSNPYRKEETMHGNVTVRNVHPVERQLETTDAKTDVCKFTNLLIAEKRCHRGVGYKNSVSRFHMYVLSKVYKLHLELVDKTYKTQKGDKFDIYEPKHRVVTSTKYKDRIPQASFVLNYMYKFIIPNLIDNNYACIKNKGVDNARNAFKEILMMSSINDYCLKADLKSYFDSIKHEKLFYEMDELIPDAWAKAYYTDVVNSNGQDIGISLGSEINQLSAVSFLNKLDHLLDRGRCLRYMDDFVFIGTKDECKKALALIESECDRLGVRVSAKKTYIQPVKNPIKFLGFSFLKHDSGKITMKRLKDKLNNEKRKLRRMKKSKVAFDDVLKHYQCVRATMKKGSRSGVVKLDKYFNELFKEEAKEYASQKK